MLSKKKSLKICCHRLKLYMFIFLCFKLTLAKGQSVPIWRAGRCIEWKIGDPGTNWGS